jgi:glycosyltransferase involved in cell wall biosynthesis
MLLSDRYRLRSLAVFGNTADIATWSNIPYFLFAAGRPAGFLSDALDLTLPDYRAARLRWSVRELLRLRSPKHYMHSADCVRRMWRRVPSWLREGDFLSHAQAFRPPDDALKRGATHSYYIDTTLAQYLGRSRDTREVLAHEAAGYRSARFVIAMARETARDLIDGYRVAPEKVFVVRPGANLHDDAVDRLEQRRPPQPWRSGAPFTPESPAVLGIIANDWQRKGLPKLVAVAESLGRRGRPVRVRVIGNCPDELTRHSLVEHAGYIRKSDEDRFLDAMAGFAVGCLLSTAEPLGISTLECLRIGVPVLGHRVGGIADCVPDDAGLLAELAETPEQIADRLEPILFDPSRYAAWCAAARSHAPRVRWATTVDQLHAIYAGDPTIRHGV